MTDAELEAAVRRHAELVKFATEYHAFGDVAIAASRFRAAYRNARGSRRRMPDAGELAAFDELEAALDDLLGVLEVLGVGDAAT